MFKELFHKKITNRERIKFTIILVIIFYFIAHGYRMTHNMYSHDALLSVYQNDYGWQIAIGRFFIPILIFIRGTLCSPWIISVLAICFHAISIYLINKILEIDNPFCILLVCGVLICNPTQVAMNAAYLCDVDFYALACCLSVLAVRMLILSFEAFEKKVTKKCVCNLLLGILTLTISLAIYQAYICMFVGLFMLYLLKQLSTSFKLKTFFFEILFFLLQAFVSSGLYYAGWKLLQRVFNIWTANSYNGLATVGDYSDTSIFAEILNCYQFVFRYFLHPDIFQTLQFRGVGYSFVWRYLLIFIHVIFVAYLFIRILQIKHERKLPLWQTIFQISILLLLPLGINAVCVISKGMVHTLMLFAFNLVYVLIIWLTTDISKSKKNTFSLFCKKGIYLSFIVILWVQIIYSNQVYLKNQFLYESAGSLLTRMTYEIEQIEEYEPDETPVILYGSYELSPYMKELTDFEEVMCMGMNKTSLTYRGLDQSYLKHILNVHMNFVQYDDNDEYLNQIIAKMPCYPKKGSVTYVDGVVIVKISDFTVPGSIE